MALTSPVQDLTTASLQLALRGLGVRQRAIAQNVANLETPGYLAKRVDFETSLRAAIDAGQPDTTEISARTAADPVNANGNNVSLDNETMAMTETGLQYQLMTQAISMRFNLLRSAIGKGA